VGERSGPVEDVVNSPGRQDCAFDADFWRGRRVLVTGHSGFIGGWTAVTLDALGAKVSGFALPPATSPSFHALTGLAARLSGAFGDIRSAEALDRVFLTSRPDIVLHLAAQPLVRVGLDAPAETFAVNVLGTVTLLDCVRRHGTEAVVVMTSDKVYAAGDVPFHGENDRLGDTDPYSASKACCELAVAAFGESFLNAARIGLATVRAGNVIGGGDWQEYRLVPDAVRAFTAGRPLALRRPSAVRPWQHVLDAVNGLLRVAQEAARCRASIGGWNIGPAPGTAITARDLASQIATSWGPSATIVCEASPSFRESDYLAVDSTHARRELGFTPPWTLPEIVDSTVVWYREALIGKDAFALTLRDIEAYQMAHRGGLSAESGV
jgi:CDP-glucose 4,6-dehydratase